MIVTLDELRDCGVPASLLLDFEMEFGQRARLTRRSLARMRRLMDYLVRRHPKISPHLGEFERAADPVWDAYQEARARHPDPSSRERIEAQAAYDEGIANVLADLLGIDPDAPADLGPQCRCASLLWGHEPGCPFSGNGRGNP